MIEQNLFQPIDTIQLYSDDIGKVILYDASNANSSEEQRQWTVATISSLAYGNEEAKHPDKLYKKLQQLGHESLSEFIRSGDSQGMSTISSSLRNENLSAYYVSPQHKQNIACFRIKVPLFVRAQFMRHRSASYLEMSRRYTKGAKIPFEFWMPEGLSATRDWADDYNQLLQLGLETQVASRFLPQTTYTEFYCMFEVEGLKNYFNLRLDSHAQEQIRDLSFSMLQLLYRHQYELYKKVVPNDEIDSRLRNEEK